MLKPEIREHRNNRDNVKNRDNQDYVKIEILTEIPKIILEDRDNQHNLGNVKNRDNQHNLGNVRRQR